jgi:hypothetical protein
MPIIRCDVAQWKIAGLSLADLNAIASGLGGVMAAALVVKSAEKIDLAAEAA